MNRRKLMIVASAILLLAPAARTANMLNASSSRRGSVEYLAHVMDRFHEKFFVYDDFLSAGNHFSERAIMCNPGDEDSVPPMVENWTDAPYSGLTCIRCEFHASGSNWGGWFFLNGALSGTDSSPRLNWGDVPAAGHSLHGATRLVFRARGEDGGEKVCFFAFGIGRAGGTGNPNKPHPDSAPQTSTGYVTLSRDWTTFSIDLQALELTNVLLGFAWQTKSTINRHRDVVFYLDDIHYDLMRLDEPRMLLSYETLNSENEFDVGLRNTAFTYDNAVALLAFLSAGETWRAGLIADALVYAQDNDREYNDGRLRNAYQGGDLALPPGWRPNGRAAPPVRIPGWWDADQRRWKEDRTMVGTHTGNMAWAMLALLSYYEVAGGEQYLGAARRMGEWIEKNCRDTRGAGGYIAGCEGWEPRAEVLLYKSTEHNIDLYAAFERLRALTGDKAWGTRARHARRFVAAMWDAREGKFWTGTGNDGVSVFRDVAPLDAQTWALLSMPDAIGQYRPAIDFIEAQCRSGAGFDFNEDGDGIWFEGTAQMAAVYKLIGQSARHEATLNLLRQHQHVSGGLPAASRDYTSTGFHLRDGTPWLYHNRLHIGATSWLVLAEQGVNPFWMTPRDAEDHRTATRQQGRDDI
jgi:hypothetical protein